MLPYRCNIKEIEEMYSKRIRVFIMVFSIILPLFLSASGCSSANSPAGTASNPAGQNTGLNTGGKETAPEKDKIESGTAATAQSYGQSAGIPDSTGETEPGPVVETPMDEKYKDWEVIIKDTGIKDEHYLDTVDLYSRNKITGEEKYILRINNYFGSVYHPCESINGSLYIIRSDYSGQYKEELWKIRPDGMSRMIYATISGLDFRVSPDESLIAVTDEFVLKLIDQTGQMVKQYTLDDLCIVPYDPTSTLTDILQWTSDGKGFFGNIFMPSGGVDSLYKVDTGTWDVAKYDLSKLTYGFSDRALNPMGSLYTYSTYPLIMDADIQKGFEDSRKKVTLYVYDLDTKKITEIASSAAKRFNPVWIDDNTLEYDNPDGSGRITKITRNN